MWCVAVAGTSNNKHSGHDLLQQEMDSSSSSLRCTLKLTAADLEHRKYGRLWASKPHWLAWQKAGGDKMRRLHQPQTFRGGEVIIDIGSYIGVDLVAFLVGGVYRSMVESRYVEVGRSSGVKVCRSGGVEVSRGRSLLWCRGMSNWWSRGGSK